VLAPRAVGALGRLRGQHVAEVLARIEAGAGREIGDGIELASGAWSHTSGAPPRLVTLNSSARRREPGSALGPRGGKSAPVAMDPGSWPCRAAMPADGGCRACIPHPERA